MGGDQILPSSLEPVTEEFGRGVPNDLVKLSLNLTNRTPSK